MKNLVIVESPAKAKTIEKYLGKDFHVLSSVGHIRSIVKKTKDGKPPIDTTNNFETIYEVDPEKKKVITELRKAVKATDEVWLATDEDREGEAIAWHLTEVLKLDPKTTKRIVFHEITKPAIETAIKSPRTVDMNLVRAQQARQILDRLVGFELSPVVWQKVPGGKSAGRVQSPAVRLLVEREREIRDFNGKSQFKITAEFSFDNHKINAELNQKFDTEEDAQKFLETLLKSSFTVSDITKSPSTRNPAAPFTTSTLQQDANAKLSFSSKATMAAAQKLYQAGHITYMRTDSVNLSGQAIASIANFVKAEYGEEYSQVRKFKTKAAGAQEAHEAIRPTDSTKIKVTSSEYDQKLYDLIRRRTIASQMAPAKLEKTTITVAIQPSEGSLPQTKKELVFEAKGEVIIFDGFLKVYGGSKKEAEILPAVNQGQILDIQKALAKQIFSKPPARYTEGSLVKKLEDLGIGRPSTYATIIDTVQARGYAEKGEGEGQERDVITLNLADNQINREIIQEKTGADRGKLIPTPSGELISDFLTGHFDQIVDYGFTADVEEQFDQIATNELDRNKMLKEFYTPFHELIVNSGGIDRSQVAQAREVGIDPTTKRPVLARFGRFGPMLQLGATEDKENKPQFAPMPPGKRIDTITLDEALPAFELPRIVGKTEDGQDIKANVGRFGPYIQVGKLFVSLKEVDPRAVTEAEARELYAQKLKDEAAKNIADFGDGIKILKGRYGPYITNGKKNVKIPKDQEPEKITHEQAKDLLKDAPAAKKTTRRGGPRKRATNSKASK